MADGFDRFTPRARRVLTLAQEEAQRLNHDYIGTEHLLLGIIGEGEGIAARVLAKLEVDPSNLRLGLEAIIGRGDQSVTGQVSLTPGAKRVIEHAVDEARRIDQRYIGTEHILLGLVLENQGIAAGVLQALGVNLENVREQVMLV